MTKDFDPSFQPSIAPDSLAELFAEGAARNLLSNMWKPSDSDWQTAYRAQRLLLDAELTEPGVNLDAIAAAVERQKNKLN